MQLRGPNLLSVGIGDVSGHGLAAGMVMSMARKALSLRVGAEEGPAAVLAKLNEDIYPDIDEEMFVTALCGWLDATSHHFTFARAGHNLPVLFTPLVTTSVVSSRGSALGIMEGQRLRHQLEEVAVPLRAGSVLLLYTEGLVEAMSPSEEEFGLDRLISAVSSFGTLPLAKQFLEGILHELDQFINGRPLDDDLTLIAIRRHPL